MTFSLNFGNLFFFIIIAGIIGIVVLHYFRAKKRTTDLQAASLESGFNFEGRSWLDPAKAPPLKTALFLTGGRGKQALNIMTGAASGLEASIFDYHYTVGGGKHSTTHMQTVIAFRKEGLQLPTFELWPEGVLFKVFDTFMRKDIDFESNPEFSKRFALRGDDPDAVRAIFTPGLLMFLEGIDRSCKWKIEGCGDTLFIYRADKRVAPPEVRGFLQESSAIAASFFSLCGARRMAF